LEGEERLTMADKIAFIGAGNMAKSLVGGLLRHGYPPASIVAADPDASQRFGMAALGVEVFDSNEKAVGDAASIVLAVKPQVMQGVVQSLKAALRTDQLLISIAAGVPSTAIARWAPQDIGIVRCMPNTPALYGVGVTALFANKCVTAQQIAAAEAILSAAGHVIRVAHESALDAVTAVSGSGPAYFFYLMEAMIDAGVALGLDAETARTLTLKTAYGAAVMANESADVPAQLRRNVTSPGGTTERASAVLDEGRCKSLIERAVQAAAQRSVELATEFGGRVTRAVSLDRIDTPATPKE
jgi:pyrroline-5-carboxylate reductase